MVKTVPQGLKPGHVYEINGTAEAVPFVKCFSRDLKAVPLRAIRFSAVCKAHTYPDKEFFRSLLSGEI
jgi:hypothetical protein